MRDYLANEGEFDTVDAGWAEASGDVQMNYAELAKELDRELDRIIRETTRS